jgi:hypothetical protein
MTLLGISQWFLARLIVSTPRRTSSSWSVQQESHQVRGAQHQIERGYRHRRDKSPRIRCAVSSIAFQHNKSGVIEEFEPRGLPDLFTSVEDLRHGAPYRSRRLILRRLAPRSLPSRASSSPPCRAHSRAGHLAPYRRDRRTTVRFTLRRRARLPPRALALRRRAQHLLAQIQLHWRRNPNHWRVKP